MMGDWQAMLNDATAFGAQREEFDRKGYVLIESVLEPQMIEDIRAALAPYIAADIAGRNDFEGLKTNRVYAMLAKGTIFADLACHPLALAFSEADLGRECLLLYRGICQDRVAYVMSYSFNCRSAWPMCRHGARASLRGRRVAAS